MRIKSLWQWMGGGTVVARGGVRDLFHSSICKISTMETSENNNEKMLPNVRGYEKEYSDRRLWAKVARVAEKAGLQVTYAVVLLYYVMKSPAVPLKTKGIIAGALGYFILPVDLVPDAIPVAGFTDDFAALVAVIKCVAEYTTPEIDAKARERLHKWFGDFDETQLKGIFFN